MEDVDWLQNREVKEKCYWEKQVIHIYKMYTDVDDFGHY
jgi:hypothetical protein